MWNIAEVESPVFLKLDLLIVPRRQPAAPASVPQRAQLPVRLFCPFHGFRALLGVAGEAGAPAYEAPHWGEGHPTYRQMSERS